MKKTVFIILLLLMVCCTTYAFAERVAFGVMDIIRCGFAGLGLGAVGDLIGFILKK